MSKLKALDRKYKISIISLLISVILVVGLGSMIKINDGPILFDSTVMEYIHSRVTEFGQDFMRVMTAMGSIKFIIFMTLVLLGYFIKMKKYNKGLFLILVTAGTSIINQGLKYLFTRTRPEMYFLIKETGYSFPSGHAMISMAFYTGMFKLLREKYSSNEGIFLALNVFIVFVVGFSRIYLGVHWPTDVLTGYIIAYTWYRISGHIYKFLVEKDFFKEEA